MHDRHYPQPLHALWVQHCTAHGWTYGPAKNWQAKQHPVIVGWHQRPPCYQARFKLWQAIVMTMMLEMPEDSAMPSQVHY